MTRIIIVHISVLYPAGKLPSQADKYNYGITHLANPPQKKTKNSQELRGDEPEAEPQDFPKKLNKFLSWNVLLSIFYNQNLLVLKFFVCLDFV